MRHLALQTRGIALAFGDVLSSTYQRNEARPLLTLSAGDPASGSRDRVGPASSEGSVSSIQATLQDTILVSRV